MANPPAEGREWSAPGGAQASMSSSPGNFLIDVLHSLNVSLSVCFRPWCPLLSSVSGSVRTSCIHEPPPLFALRCISLRPLGAILILWFGSFCNKSPAFVGTFFYLPSWSQLQCVDAADVSRANMTLGVAEPVDGASSSRAGGRGSSGACGDDRHRVDVSHGSGNGRGPRCESAGSSSTRRYSRRDGFWQASDHRPLLESPPIC
jgi:hypothetical protein